MKLKEGSIYKICYKNPYFQSRDVVYKIYDVNSANNIENFGWFSYDEHECMFIFLKSYDGNSNKCDFYWISRNQIIKVYWEHIRSCIELIE